MDLPETHHHHHTHTSHRWLDIALGMAAMFVSVTSLVVAVEHGHTMQRLVEANSWPILQFETHNIGGPTNTDSNVRLVIVNAGVGPARIETLEMWWKGQPIPTYGALIKVCCTKTPEAANQMATSNWTVHGVTPSILRAGEHVDLIALPETPQNHELWEEFNQERANMTARLCYCSVFDECWRVTGTSTHPERIESCPTPAVPFRPIENAKETQP